jgi:hypothetical protein
VVSLFCLGPLEYGIVAFDVLIFQAGNVFGVDPVVQVREQPEILCPLLLLACRFIIIDIRNIFQRKGFLNIPGNWNLVSPPAKRILLALDDPVSMASLKIVLSERT